jgi:hypothetical protein
MNGKNTGGGVVPASVASSARDAISFMFIKGGSSTCGKNQRSKRDTVIDCDDPPVTHSPRRR